MPPKNDAAPISGGAGVKDRSSQRKGIATTPTAQHLAALKAAGFGWAIVPLHHPLFTGKRPCCSCDQCFSCRHTGKHPRFNPTDLGHGARSASNLEGLISKWWSQWPDANIGIATGAISGIVVIDIDPRNGGDVAFQELQDRLGRLPDTVEVQTGGGGRHLYFQYVGELRGKWGPGVDLLSDGQLVVAPGSLHPSGVQYVFELSSDPSEVAVAELPLRWREEFISSRDGVEGDDREDSGDGEDGDTNPTSVSTAIPVHPAVPANTVIPVGGPKAAGSKAEGWTIERVIDETLPTGRGQHDRKTLDLARGLKLNVRLCNVQEAKAAFDRWFSVAQPFISDQDWDEGWAKFVRAWEKANIPLGDGGFAEEALRRAHTATPPRIALEARTDRARLLITMMRELSLLVKGPFKLSTHQLGRLFGVSNTRAWEWLRGLEAHGVLKCLNRGVRGRPGHGAAKFEYIGGG
jgi:hypothetical protein